MHKPVKSLGQNFLNSQKVIDHMINALELDKDPTDIVEIGPGLGVLTTPLSRKYDVKVTAVEVDVNLIPVLKDKFKDTPQVSIVEANILKWLPDHISAVPFKVIGSLPYYITSPILHALVKMETRPKICVLMVQKEVGKKVAADAPDSSYLSSFVQAFYSVEYLETVPRSVFNPQPNVDSAILKLVAKPISFTPEEIRKFEGFLHKGFANPRKMINKAFSREELERGKIDASIRPQNLSSEEWLEFFNSLRTDAL